MKIFLIVGFSFLAIASFGQADSTSVDRSELKRLLTKVQKNKKKFDTLEKDFSEKELRFTPIIDKSGLTSIQVKQKDRLLYIFEIDPKTYKIIGEIDWR